MASTRLRELEAVCERYGPGRLPGADRRTIGAGYAGATAALGVTGLFAIVMVVTDAVGTPFGVGNGGFAVVAIGSLPLVVPVAFLAGALVWRVLPGEGAATGAVGGLLATLGTYLGSLAVLYVLVVALAVSTGNGGLDALLIEAGWFVVLVGIVSFVWTCWLTIPIGCVSGAIYESARAVRGPSRGRKG